MRRTSFVPILGAALLPVASAKPLCRPDRPTTATQSSIATVSTTVEILNTDSVTTATSIAVSTETTIDTSTAVEFTSSPETTITESQTTTATLDQTTVETLYSTTSPAEPVITELATNGSFEDRDNTVWNRP